MDTVKWGILSTADINRRLGDSSALRLNLMRREGGVDGRDYVENSSYGVAPSIASTQTPSRRSTP